MTEAVAKLRAKIEAQINVWEGYLVELQSLCTHECTIKETRGNTGNYDPSADYYWTECKCPDCGKFWKEYN